MTPPATGYPAHWLNETSIPLNKRLILDKDLIRSRAFLKLTGPAKQIYLELYMRLTVDCLKSGRGKKDARYFAKNNGKLVLSYKTIETMFGYSTRTISKAIDQLCDYGLIEIAKIGIGVKREHHEIALIKNWRDFGTPDFRPGKGKANKPVNGGFKKKSTVQSKAV